MKAKQETIGERIYAERTRLKWTQMELAIQTETTPDRISRIESGDAGVGIDLGRRICRAFSWDLNTLFGHKESK